jgi:ubiquinone/menaquinone biosynthesis C-methylase UbiE
MQKTIDYKSLAELYDSYVQETFDIEFYLKEAKKAAGQVLELMAGTGRVSIPLLKQGIPLTCLDKSRKMLNVLNRKLVARGLNALTIKGDIRRLNINGKFDIIFIAFHSFEELVEKSNQKKAIIAVRRHLSPKGRFICSLHNPKIRLQNIDGKMRLWKKCQIKETEYTLHLSGKLFYNPDTHIVTGKQHLDIFDTENEIISQKSVDIEFYLYQKSEFEVLVKQAGFEIKHLYGDFKYRKFHENTSPFMIWILENRNI